MTEQVNQDPIAESQLLDIPIPPVSSNTFDEQPIGGGSKFQLSEYPSENDVPPVRKAPPARKPTKPKKEQSKVQVEEMPPKTSQPLDEIPVGGNKNPSMFDEKPIGKSQSAFMMSEFPEGQPEQAATTNYTMAQKLKSKAAKLRLEGLEDLLQLLISDPESSQLADITLAQFLKQTSPANMQKSLQCLKAWMQAGRNWGEDEARNAIQSGYINGKANTKKITVEIIDAMYEAKADMIEMIILVGFKSKTPKIIAGYNSVLNELLAIYGVKRMKYLKPYLPEVIRVIGAEKLAAVKTEGMNTLRESYKWMSKEVIAPMLGNLKQALQKQLDTWWETYDKTIVMTAPKDLPQEGGKNKGKKVDAYELSQAVDIFKKYNEKWEQSVLKAEKWNQKTKMMEQFVKSASVPKLANTQWRHMGELIRRLINDSNMNVVLWTMKVLAVMARGLRKHFKDIARAQFSNIIGKFRQKKTQMVDETFATLNDLNHCLGLEDVIEDVKEGIVDKAPNMRCNMLNWIGKHIEQKMEEKGGECPQKTKDAVKRLFPNFQKLLEDGVSEVRQTMAKNLAKMELLLGEDFVAPVKAKMNKNLGSKIKVEQPKILSKKNQDSLNKSGVNLKPPKPETNSKPVVGGKPNTPIEKQKEEKQVLESFDEPLFQESLQILVGLGLPEEEVKNVTASGAVERGKFLNYLRQNPYQNFNAVIRVIRKSYKQWKEVNLNMNKDLISYLQERSTDICKPQSYVLIPFICEKIADPKFSESLMGIITTMCQRVPAKFLIGHVLRYVRSPENKKPKLNGDVCSILVKIVDTASIVNCNLKELAEYGKQSYAVVHSKKGGQQLLACLYLHAGDSVKAFLDEATLKSMQGQFKNIKPLSDDQKKPKVQFEGEAAATQNKMAKKESGKQDGKPRDLSVQVQKALPLMNDNSNWQKRKEGAELLTGQLQFGGKISFGPQVGDLLACLKIHINDTNKQLIKVFVHLAGLVIVALSEKQLKINLKGFITALVEGLSDKNQQNRREITLALGRIADSLGKQHILNNMGPYLEGDKEGRLQVLHLIIAHEDGISRSDIRDYPKGLVNCLCDKNKDIRAAAEKVFERVYQKLGLQVFKVIAKDHPRPAVAKDLSNFLEKFDRNAMTTSSFNSKGVSPSRISEKQYKPRPTLTQPPQPPSSAKKRSVSRNNGGKSFIDHEDEPHAATISAPFFAAKMSKVEGNQPFASKGILINERQDRVTNENLYIWRLDKLQQVQQDSVREDIQSLVNQKIAKKLLSMDYSKVLEGLSQIIKASKEVNYQDQLKQIFDVLFKWSLLKLWGGQPAFCSVIEVIFPLLSILQKKKMILTDFQVDLTITIIRQYFISASLLGNKVNQSLYHIIKCLVPLSSGERVLRKILKQFSVDLPALHRHLSREANSFYREGLSRLIKNQLASHVGTGDTMQQASKIKELKQDPQFVNILRQRYRDDVLHSFGFKITDNAPQAASLSPHNPPPPPLNGSGVSYKPQTNSTINNGSFVSNGEQRERSGERLPNKGHPNTQTQDLRPSQLPGKPLDRNKNPSLQQIHPPQPPLPPSAQHSMQQTPYSTVIAQPMIYQQWTNPYESKSLDLSVYPAPHPASPLSKHLSKLLPPNDNIINFFNTLFQESGEKIANQLTSNSKIIFGSILKSVQDLIEARREHTPDRLVTQITLLQSCIKCPHIIRNIGQLLGYGTSFALTQLVYQDEHKAEIYEQLRSRNIQYRADNFIKAINGVMLRILQNAHAQQTVNVLLELLTFHSRAMPNSPKTISLVVKCLGRVAKDYMKQLRPEAIKLFITRAHEYLSAIDYDTLLEQLDLPQKERSRQKIRHEDTAANIIKGIVTELCNLIRSQIWEHYEKAMAESSSPDKWICSFISALNVKPPEKGRGRSQPAKENQQLKKINDLLSKNRSYEQGIVQLKKYAEKHPEFNAEEYFTSLNYDRKFITMVVGSLDGQRRTMLRGQNQEQEGAPQNIQERIRRLKQRFQELQPEGQGSGNSSMNRQKPPQEEDQREERALEIRRRIEQMKNKMNSAVRNKR